MNVSYVIKEHIWTSDSDEGTPKKKCLVELSLPQS